LNLKHPIPASPLLVIGMHRSGTTLVCKLLQQMDCFMGFRREANEEATFFRRLNDTILMRHGALWNHPTPFKKVLLDPQACQALAQEMRHKIRQFQALEYWGPLLRRGIQRKYKYWGWKDPRMSIVLPIWLDAFPDAAVIQVVRNGVDVANSLRNRDIRMRKENRKKLPVEYPSLMENFQLWCEYMECSERAINNLQGNLFTIRYESLLESSDTIIHDLGEFLGIEAPTNLNRIVNRARKYAFLDKPELLTFYHQIKNHPYMVRYNYQNIAQQQEIIIP